MRLASPGLVGCPLPSPAMVHVDPLPVDVVDVDDRPVGVTGRGMATAAPARLSVPGRGWAVVSAWAGPWPADEHWWDSHRHRRRARFQVLLADGGAHLLAVEGGRWWLEEATSEVGPAAAPSAGSASSSRTRRSSPAEPPQLLAVQHRQIGQPGFALLGERSRSPSVIVGVGPADHQTLVLGSTDQLAG